MFDLTGTVVVLTGGDGGIELGMARALVRAGVGTRPARCGHDKDLGGAAVAVASGASRVDCGTALHVDGGCALQV